MHGRSCRHAHAKLFFNHIQQECPRLHRCHCAVCSVVLHCQIEVNLTFKRHCSQNFSFLATFEIEQFVQLFRRFTGFNWISNATYYFPVLFFFSLQLLQLESKGNWLGQQRKIFMLKPQELKPKSSAVTCCQETCQCFSFCSQNTYPLLFLTFDVDDDDANYMTMVTFDSVSAFLRRSFFLSVGVSRSYLRSSSWNL